IQREGDKPEGIVPAIVDERVDRFGKGVLYLFHIRPLGLLLCGLVLLRLWDIPVGGATLGAYHEIGRLTMEKVFRLVCVGMVGLLLLSAGRAGAQDIEYSRATLRGLEGVRVLVENIDTDAQADGLTQQQLQTAVELQLRKEGIPVLSMTQMPGTPYLYVAVTAHKDKGHSFYHYCFRVE